MRLLRVLGEALVEVFVTPIRDGHPRPGQWPRGIGPTMLVATVGYLVATGMAVAAPLILRHDSLVVIEGSEVIGAATLTAITWLISVTLAIGLTAVLHIQPVVRVIALILLVTPLLPLMTAPERGWAAAVGVLGIVVFFVIRAQGRFTAWEFPTLWLLVCLALLVPLGWETNLGFDQRTMMVQLVLLMMMSLAVPALLMAGYAASQISVSLAQWLGFRSTEVLSRPVLKALVTILGFGYLGLAGWQTIHGALGWGGPSWIGSVLVVLACAGVVVTLRLGLPTPHRNLDHPADPDSLAGAWRRPAYLLALLMLGPMLLSDLTAVGGAMVGMITGSTPDWLATFSSSSTSVVIVRLAQTGLALLIGWRSARRGDAISPVVLGSYAAAMFLSSLSIATGWRWLSWESGTVGALLVVAMLALMAASNGAYGLHHGLVICLLVWIYPVRELLSEPSAIFVTASAGILLLVGLVWRVLTDGELTRGDSPQFPRASRVLVYASMSLLAVLALAVTLQTRVVDSPLDQTMMVGFGDRTLGGALYLAAGLASLSAIAERLVAARSR